MAALNFQERWVDAIVAGRKSQTIRPLRRRPIRPGERLVLYTGQRTRRCRKIGEARCRSVLPLRRVGNMWYLAGAQRPLAKMLLENLARLDGFETLDDFFAWFARYPPNKTFVVITWEGLALEPWAERVLFTFQPGQRRPPRIVEEPED